MRSVFISALSPISINHLPSFMQCLCRASSIYSQTLIGLTHRSLFRLRLHRWSSIGCQSCQRLRRKRWQRQRQSDSDCESNQLHRKVCQLGKSWAQGFWQLSWHGTKKRRHDTCLHRSKSRATATATASERGEYAKAPMQWNNQSKRWKRTEKRLARLLSFRV